MPTQQPLVSVVTPVYNGEQFLKECIESILTQDYDNWEYIILDNCSTDSTPEIIQEYAKSETRIKVFRNESLLPIMDNWNSAVDKISPQSIYCKVVHADDKLYSNCLDLMVEAAEKSTSVGIVGSYSRWGLKVACDGLPDSEIISGREVCRLTLLRKIYPFLSPSCLLIRSSLVRERKPFYPGPDLQADVDVLYQLLGHCDFGFVPHVLSFIRRHESSATETLTRPRNTLLSQRLKLLLKHGPDYLSEAELKSEIRIQLQKYYTFLAKSARNHPDRDFWSYHRQALRDIGYPLSQSRLRIFRLLTSIRRVVKNIAIRTTNSLLNSDT